MPTEGNGTFRICEPTLAGNELRYVIQAVLASDISGKGSYVAAFERAFAKAIEAKYAVAVSSGSTALLLAAQALGIGSGDTIICPTFTMAATAFAPMMLGAKCRWVDCTKNGNINPDYLEEKIDFSTKAIFVTHIYGQPCQMDRIMEIAKKHNLPVIEDAAEAHGASFDKKFVGTIGDIGCFSFYANKIVAAGEGGMCVTNDENLYRKMLTLREYAMEETYVHRQPALNLRLGNLNAAVGLAQVEQIQKLVTSRLVLSAAYENFLKDTDIKRAEFKPGSVCWHYWVRVKNRDEVAQKLAEAGIETRPFFVPMHLQPFNDGWDTQTSYPISEMLAEQGLLLPSSSHLSLSDIKFICEKLKAVAV